MHVTEQRQNHLEVSQSTQIVHRLGYRLLHQASQHICDRLSLFMALPHQLNQMNANLIIAGHLNTNEPIACSRHFWGQAKIFKSISYLGFALTDGSKEAGAGRWINGIDLAVYENRNYRGFDYAADEKGNRTHLIQSYDYDPLSQPWHKQAMEVGKPMWSHIYTAEIDDVEVAISNETPHDSNVFSNNLGYECYVGINAEHPMRDSNGNLFGLVVVDVLLIGISQLLSTLNVSPNGHVFIVERNGMLVGSSEQQSILRKVDDRTERFSAFNTPDPVIRQIAGELQKQFNTFQSIETVQLLDFHSDGEHQFVQVSPWSDDFGLDWLVIVSMPESDLME
jgi:hypothetical protein